MIYHIIILLYRMFSSTLDVKPNEHGEYEVAKGVSASIFRAIMVREAYAAALCAIISRFLYLRNFTSLV